MLYKFKNYSPKVAENTFIAPGSKIIGNVELSEHSSVWYNSVVRADLARIKIGKFSNVQENSTIHVEQNRGVEIGDYVTIGHNAVIHACKIADKSLIGMNTTILSGAKIGEGSIVGAGAVVPENAVIPPGSLVLGVPAKIVRSITKEKIIELKQHAIHYAELAAEQENSEITE
ncbi:MULTISPECIES: gamma carbonic anhydrase family protein [Halanaerobium]|jgi:carbonic anhydrase/acetyltransferase-like protein (isoleucine patch superfamily)|uniref:Carbonic anhydrase or acetyltransferase, isoleucine patch superfamily n=1 Tax=Halanaerobium kushneri TaxID=56779 RepID=A0A1N6V040_9FIRM|nr:MULTISPECIES: gamma carbonic anhydrase family protein [Halanaerobium]RCW58287.1 carbonic anhydrase/acetyltransferase-like protein (isoleucine patch superfamily) [Halanaerobium sp. ST460_2HS_T2]SIQ71182.1 Carbonic anhydrase or acetyltransferase, isoleucine patch superfamily [Halanaerobium kushneri]